MQLGFSAIQVESLKLFASTICNRFFLYNDLEIGIFKYNLFSQGIVAITRYQLSLQYVMNNKNTFISSKGSSEHVLSLQDK